MGVHLVPAAPGFLQGLRDLCDKQHVLLIFDEIVTGFRLAYGGAQERYGVTPDICTMGKIIGGGFPLAALGASTEIMAHFDKESVGAEKWLMQLGTLSGNPVAAAAGLKTMEILRRVGNMIGCARLVKASWICNDQLCKALELHIKSAATRPFSISILRQNMSKTSAVPNIKTRRPMSSGMRNCAIKVSLNHPASCTLR